MNYFNKRVLIIAGVLLDAASRAQAGGLIGNSQVALGVRTCAALNEEYNDAFGWGADPANEGYVGMRDRQTGTFTSVESGCLCESWTAMVRGSDGNYPLWCGDSAREGQKNIGCEFEHDDQKALSTGVCRMPEVGHFLDVTHDFHPSSQVWLYEIDVTIHNPTSNTYEEVLYNRILDWDIDPTPFQEYVTIQGTKKCSAVEVAHDNGFCSVDPNTPCSSLLFSGDAVDVGPSDHGAYFKFNLGELGPGGKVKFTIYYGVSQRDSKFTAEQTALNALAAVGASVYTLGQNKFDPLGGHKHTFIFAYKCCQDTENWKFDCEVVSQEPDYYCRFDIVQRFCPHICWSLDCDDVAKYPTFYCKYPWIRKNCRCACEDYGPGVDPVPIDPVLVAPAPLVPVPIDPVPIDKKRDAVAAGAVEVELTPDDADTAAVPEQSCLQQGTTCNAGKAVGLTARISCCPGFTCEAGTCVVDMQGPLKSRESNDEKWFNGNFDADCESESLCEDEVLINEARIYCPRSCPN